MNQKSGETSHGHEENSEDLTNEQLKAAQDVGKAALDSMDESELDDLLDEIDEVLESNAEEFVKGFIQKGGE